MSDRPTPETDALRKSIDSGANAEAEMTSFARKLERERDKARAEIIGWKNKWECAVEMAARAELEIGKK